jgi:succinylglutamate desuccinylase
VYLFSSRKKKRYIQSNQNRGIEGKQKKMKNEDHLFAVEMTTEWAMHAAQFFDQLLYIY